METTSDPLYTLNGQDRQLSFDIGMRGSKPDFASLKISGDFVIGRDLHHRTALHVCVTGPDGEVLAERPATITGVAFKDKTDKYGTTTERVHTAALA